MQTNRKIKNSSRLIEYSISWEILQHLKELVTDDKVTNEFSGIFEQSRNETVTGKHIHSHGSCSQEYECLAHANITKGHGDSAHFYDHVKFTYHTHPKFYYTEYEVKIAPPSGEDIGIFLRGCIEKKTCVHLVLSLEGIYIMIANPCFVRQARNLLKLNTPKSLGYYNIALIGAEILGMETHEYRQTWTTDEWLEWVRSRFVCKSIETRSYEKDIREKFGYYCSDDTCEGFDNTNDQIQKFQELFKEIVRTSFQLAQCSEYNPIQESKWTEGNWIDVDFVSWSDAENLKQIVLRYTEV